MNLPYISVENKHYVYVLPARAGNIIAAKKELETILNKYSYGYSQQQLNNLFTQQENRYVKLADGISAGLAKQINDLKNDNYEIKNTCEKSATDCIAGIPLLH